MFGRFLLDPDPEIGGSLDTPEPEVADAPVLDTPEPDLGTGAAEAEWEGVREASKSLGMDLGDQFQDDRAALAHLVSQAQAARQDSFYTNLGRQLAPHAQKVQDYLRQQAAPAPAAPQRNSFDPPEYNAAWMQMVERDEATGLVRSRAGYDPAIGQKVQEWADYQNRIAQDPSLFNQRVEHKAREVAQTLVREQLSEYRTQEQVNRILEGNASWMYARDKQGNATYAQDGRPMPSAVGSRYLTHVQALSQYGITDPNHLDAVAKQLLRAELTGQQAPAKPGPLGAHPNRNPLQALDRQTQAALGEPGAAQKGLSIRERLAAEFQAENYSDADLETEFAGTVR